MCLIDLRFIITKDLHFVITVDLYSMDFLGRDSSVKVSHTNYSVLPFLILLVCNMNVHKRCQKNVANNCGINTKQLSEILSALGISSQKLQAAKKKKVRCLMLVKL